MDINTLIGKVITRSHDIEKLLQKHYSAPKGGLFAAINSLEATLPAILFRSIKSVAIIRNAAAHPDGFTSDSVPSDFDRLCNEIELLIPYFAGLQHNKPAQPPKQPKPPTEKPQPPAASAKPIHTTNGVAISFPANHGKSWTQEEDKMLVNAFDEQVSIPELAKAHQRGIGGVQNRLTKLGRLTADQYITYPPVSK